MFPPYIFVMRKRFNKNKKRRSNNRRRGYSLLRLKQPIMADTTRLTLKATCFQAYTFTSIDSSGVYSGNGLANPFLGNSVLQAPGFIDWMVFYEKYRVLRSSIFIQMINDGAEIFNRAIWLCVYPSRTTTPLPNGYVDPVGQPYAKVKFVGAPNGMDRATLRHSMSTSKFWGMNCRYEDDFIGQVDTNPVNQWYWQLGATGLPDSTNFPVLSFMVSISYDVLLFQRKPQSSTSFE